MIFGILMSFISFIIGVIQINRGSDIGGLICVATSIIFYVLYIINLHIEARNINIKNYLKAFTKEELNENQSTC